MERITLKRKKYKSKYIKKKIDGKTIDLHRHIMEKHLGRKLTRREVIHHIDGNKHNNKIENLKLMTSREHNILHGCVSVILNNRNKIILKGEQIGTAKLNRIKVIMIRKLYSTGKYTMQNLADKFNISKTQIVRTVNKKQWNHIK